MTELLKRFEEAVANEETDLVEKIYRDAINKDIADPLQTLYESYFATYFQFEPILVSGKDTLKKDCLRIKEKRIAKNGDSLFKMYSSASIRLSIA